MKQLSNDEMKKVVGGLATFTGETCTWSYVSGTKPNTIDSISLPGANPNGVQALADSMCWEDDNCLGVDCPGAD